MVLAVAFYLLYHLSYTVVHDSEGDRKMTVIDREWQDGDDTIMVEEAIDETLGRMIAVLVEARDADEKLQKEIHANAHGRFMTQDEDADQSYLEGKITAYNHAIQLLVEG
jgi:hypothetical protein